MMFETIESWALHAFADGELSEAERHDIERLLQREPEAQNLLDAIRRQKSALHLAFDEVLTEPVPPRLVQAAMARQPIGPQLASWRNVAAAGLVALAIGAGAGWFARPVQVQASETLADRAVNIYKVFATDANHPVEMAAVEKDQLEHWLGKRIGVSFAIPDLGPQGYSLVGGRLLAEGDRPAGLLMYENASKQRLAVYVAANPAHDESAMVVQDKGGIVSCYWVEKDMVYALAGEQRQADMLALAAAAHAGFDKDG